MVPRPCSCCPIVINSGWRTSESGCDSARDQRSRPGRDDKIVAAWNALLVDSLVQAAMVFGRSDWLATRGSRRAPLAAALAQGRLRRTSRAGEVGTAPGILEDYAALASAATRLAAARADAGWIDRARQLLAVVLEHFDDDGRGFFDTAAEPSSCTPGRRTPPITRHRRA